MRTVLYSCAFVPGEWIAAHGFHPLRVMPPASRDHSREGLCPFVRGLVHHVAATKPAAVIFTTVCDQMRRAEDILNDSDTPAFILHVPAAQKSLGATDYYRSELQRLGAFLCDLGGTSPSSADVLDVMKQYDFRREAERQETIPSDGLKRLALVGGELLLEDHVIFDLIRQAGGRVVLDATDYGRRTIPTRFRIDQIGDSLSALVEAYFGAIPHAFRRPNDGLYDYLAKETTNRGVQGIVFRHYPWCDTWNAELPRIRDALGLPLLRLDSRCDGSDTNRQAGRIEAFLEALS